MEFVFWCHLLSVSNTMLKGTYFPIGQIALFSFLPGSSIIRKWEVFVIPNDYVLSSLW